eukprot:5468521-Pleurochrysis_carterae.AAC.3
MVFVRLNCTQHRSCHAQICLPPHRSASRVHVHARVLALNHARRRVRVDAHVHACVGVLASARERVRVGVNACAQCVYSSVCVRACVCVWVCVCVCLRLAHSWCIRRQEPRRVPIIFDTCDRSRSTYAIARCRFEVGISCSSCSPVKTYLP